MTGQKISLNAFLPVYLLPFAKGIFMKSHTFKIQAVYKTALAFISYLHKTSARGDLLSQVFPGHMHSFAHYATI